MQQIELCTIILLVIQEKTFPTRNNTRRTDSGRGDEPTVDGNFKFSQKVIHQLELPLKGD